MSGFIVYGLLFWSACAFAGSRRAFMSRRGVFYDLFGNLRDSYPLLLTAATLVCGVISIVFLRAEMRSLETPGMIGVDFLLSVVFGMLGAFGLSAHVYIDSD